MLWERFPTAIKWFRQITIIVATPLEKQRDASKNHSHPQTTSIATMTLVVIKFQAFSSIRPLDSVICILYSLMKDHHHDVSFSIKLAAFQASCGADT
jgi:hypothetical protein